jgi:hypothetical protein
MQVNFWLIDGEKDYQNSLPYGVGCLGQEYGLLHSQLACPTATRNWCHEPYTAYAHNRR